MKTRAIAFRLTVLALACGLAVGAMHAMTRPTIDANRRDFEQRQLREVAGDRYDLSPIGDDVFALLDDNDTRGFLFSVSTTAGYNGTIRLWMAVDTSGSILGVRVREHHETPGLGDKIDTRVSDWMHEFDGKDDTARFDVKRDGGDFDQFTGATITPRAVVHAVRDGLEDFDEHKAEWQKRMAP